jgi:hypothetical protein
LLRKRKAQYLQTFVKNTILLQGASVKAPEDPVKAKVIGIVKKCSADNKATAGLLRFLS